MNALNLTVRVQNLSPRASRSELEMLFSYCGTVEKIELERDEDRSQSALVTFRQPFAYQAALLMNDVPVAGQPIRVLPSQETTVHNISQECSTRDDKRNQGNGSPSLLLQQQDGASHPASNMATFVCKTKSAISTAARETAKICAVIITYDPVITALLLLSVALHRVARHELEEWIVRRNLPVLDLYAFQG